jgi:hypothetical protein
MPILKAGIADPDSSGSGSSISLEPGSGSGSRVLMTENVRKKYN